MRAVKKKFIFYFLFFYVTRSTETDQQSSVDQWPGQRDQNNNHNQRFSVDFLLIRPQFFLVVKVRWGIIPHSLSLSFVM
jgi:hypothetical protein